MTNVHEEKWQLLWFNHVGGMSLACAVSRTCKSKNWAAYDELATAELEPGGERVGSIASGEDSLEVLEVGIGLAPWRSQNEVTVAGMLRVKLLKKLSGEVGRATIIDF